MDDGAVVSYHIDVTTGLQSAANSSIRVFIQLFGSIGDSGRRLLHQSTSSASCFLPGQTDSFELEAVCLGELTKLIISHNTITAGILIDFSLFSICSKNIRPYTFQVPRVLTHWATQLFHSDWSSAVPSKYSRLACIRLPSLSCSRLPGFVQFLPFYRNGISKLVEVFFCLIVYLLMMKTTTKLKFWMMFTHSEHIV